MSEIKSEIVEKLRMYLKEVDGVCHVEKAFVFGSHAKGNAGRDSDIDMAIFSRTVNDKNRLEVMTRIIALIRKFKLDIQPVVFSYDDYLSDENDFICNEVKKNGLELRGAFR